MAFGADELRVLRRALAVALQPAPLPDEDIQDCLRLAESVDEAIEEAGRLRAFLVADLARYRAALPGSLTGYLELLQDALAAGYQPQPDDLAALRALRGNPLAAVLLDRCLCLAEQAVRARLAKRATAVAYADAIAAPGPRTRLHALPGGRVADEPKTPREPREPAAPPRPAPGGPKERPMPKPSEVFPPRRRPAAPPEKLAAG
ncbi:hypothetical protein [Streptomyces sp. NPDC088725]|uniref:hypothetical protein n=1 Tax=Streptomyces sp. NPDC088725 TaxID=3365873 RepID=UPI0038021D33